MSDLALQAEPPAFHLYHPTSHSLAPPVPSTLSCPEAHLIQVQPVFSPGHGVWTPSHAVRSHAVLDKPRVADSHSVSDSVGFPQYLSFPPRPQRLQFGHQILGILPTIGCHLAFQLEKRQHRPTVLSNEKAGGMAVVPGGRLWARPTPQGPGEG